jgi:hypothetical protein
MSDSSIGIKAIMAKTGTAQEQQPPPEFAAAAANDNPPQRQAPPPPGMGKHVDKLA